MTRHTSKLTLLRGLRNFVLLATVFVFGFATFSASAKDFNQSVDSALKSEANPLILVSPADQTTIVNPNVEFKWMSVPNAVEYRLKVQGVGFNYKATVSAAACVADVCSFSPVGDPKWFPKLGVNLRWSVTTKVEHTKFKSENWTLLTDFLPKSIALYTPAAESTVYSNLVAFSWQNDPRVGTFRLEIRPDNADEPYFMLISPLQSCDTMTCTVNVDLASFEGSVFNGRYTWRVVATRDDVKGKAKSDKLTFKTELLPELELEYPFDGMTLDITNPEFMWIDPLVIDEYRIVAVGMNGEEFKTDWTDALDWCDEDDCYTDSLHLPNNVYEWHVEGRMDGIDGKAKSEKWTMTIYVPEATPEPLPLP